MTGLPIIFMNKQNLRLILITESVVLFFAAITASLARDIPLNKAVGLAKNYVREAIDHGLYLNDFTGYVWHGAYFQTDTRLNERLNEQEMPHE